MTNLKRCDLKLLRQIMASNGGGVEFEYSYARFVPRAQEQRLLKLGLIRRKPNHAGMFIHTDKTQDAIAAGSRRAKTGTGLVRSKPERPEGIAQKQSPKESPNDPHR